MRWSKSPKTMILTRHASVKRAALSLCRDVRMHVDVIPWLLRQGLRRPLRRRAAADAPGPRAKLEHSHRGGEPGLSRAAQAHVSVKVLVDLGICCKSCRVSAYKDAQEDVDKDAPKEAYHQKEAQAARGVGVSMCAWPCVRFVRVCICCCGARSVSTSP